MIDLINAVVCHMSFRAEGATGPGPKEQVTMSEEEAGNPVSGERWGQKSADQRHPYVKLALQECIKHCVTCEEAYRTPSRLQV